MTDYLSDIVYPFQEGVRITVRAKPGLSRSREARVVDIGDGKRAIEITVFAAAQDGKANRAILDRLAEELGLRKSELEIKSGSKSRLKIIEITGAPDTLQKRLVQWLHT
jgi:hypothetical protein